jgi:hypothetical protein
VGVQPFHRSATAQDFNLFCELRPVFEDYAYPPDSQPDAARYTKLIEIMPLIVLQVLTNDEHKFAVQMNEQQFADLTEATARVSAQLEIIKSRVKIEEE